MGRPLRLTYRGAMHHVTMRCNNKEFLFDRDSQRLFVDLLRETCERFNSRLYNYCVMTNHVHLLFDVNADGALSQLMHRLANVFAKRFNAIHERKGHLWEGRFVSTILEAPAYFLRCMAYVDLNPVRAGIVTDPVAYPWSAHRHVVAEDQSRVALHPLYLELGKTPAARRAAYAKVLGAEASRPPHSLAGMLLVGSPAFARRMQRRFGVLDSARPRVETIVLGGGVQAIGLRPGGRVARFRAEA